MTDFRSHCTFMLRRAAAVLPTHNPLRQRLSRWWDRLLMLSGRHVDVAWAGRIFRLQVGFRHLDATYEADAVAAWRLLIQPGDVVWDVGANIGLYSLLTAELVGPEGHVTAWEPSPQTFAVLQDHLTANQIGQRCRAVQAAIGDRNGATVPFLVEAEWETNPTNRLGTAANSTTVQVSLGTLDGWLSELDAPQFVKIDIEGAEVLALRGASRLLSECRPVLMLAVHPMFLPEFHCNTVEISQILQKHGYECWTLSGQLAQPTEYSEYLCIPAEKKGQWLARLKGR